MADLYSQKVGKGAYKVSNTHQAYDVGDVNKYGESRSSMIEANPYASFDYNVSPWQQFLHKLGFRTNADAYAESMSLQAKEYDAALAEKSYNEQYDSAAAQAQRERAAGMNPDLTGNVDAGESSALRDDGNPPVAPEDDTAVFANVATGLMGSIETLFGLVESGYGLAGLAQDVEAKKLANDKNFIQNVDEIFQHTSLVNGNQRNDSSDSWFWRFGYDRDSRLGQLLGRRSKKYYKAVNLTRESLAGRSAETSSRLGLEKDRKALAGLLGRSTNSEFDDVLEAFEGCLQDLAYLEQSTSLARDSAQNTYETNFYESMDSSRMAEAGMSKAENEVRLTSAEAGRASSEKKMLDARYEAKNSLDSLSKHLDQMDGFIPILGRILVDFVKVRMFGL